MNKDYIKVPCTSCGNEIERHKSRKNKRSTCHDCRTERRAFYYKHVQKPRKLLVN